MRVTAHRSASASFAHQIAIRQHDVLADEPPQSGGGAPAAALAIALS
jgi:hypothetical protein